MIAKLMPNRVRRTYGGGGRIDAFVGTHGRAACPHAAADGMPRPEDWLASTTTAFNGTLEIDGEGLGRLEDGRLVKDVVGELPILVKLLDSDERLVIQAHPTVPCAKRLFNSSVGKTECWYFLPGTAPDACVYLGFKPGITRTAWEQAVWKNIANTNLNSQLTTQDSKLLLDMLHRIPVKSGDFVFVDGGVPHAIGGGCFMVELQEPSDLMVVAERFTPSGRRIPDAKMHGGVGWDKMLEVYEYEGLDHEEVCRRYVRRGNVKSWKCENESRNGTNGNCHNCSQIANTNLCASASLREAYCICGPEFTDKFSMWRINGGGRLELLRDGAVAVVTDGDGVVNGLAVKRGDRLLVAGEGNLETEGHFSIVACT